MARTITVRRSSSFLGAAVGFFVLLDGNEVAKLGVGASTNLTVDEGMHTITVRTAFKSNEPCQITVPSGSEGYAYLVQIKMGMIRNHLIITQTDVFPPAGNAVNRAPVYNAPAYNAPVNGLDDYRLGGPKCYRPSEDQIHQMTLSELEGFMVGNSLGSLLIQNGIDLQSYGMQQMYRETGIAVGSVKATFAVMEGHCKYTMTYYSDGGFRNEITTIPYDQTFDWMISTNEEERHCKAASHNLEMITRAALSVVVKQNPNAWMQDGILYSKRP